MHSLTFNETKTKLLPFGMSAAGVSTWMTPHKSWSDDTYQDVMGLVRKDFKKKYTRHTYFWRHLFMQILWEGFQLQAPNKT